MTEPVDYYQVLSVDPAAGPDAIHQAYRALARACHPDVNPGAAAARHMTLLNEAYACLSNPERRCRYDETRAVREPRALREAVLDAALALLADAGWTSARIGPGDRIFEGHGQRVFVRAAPLLGSSEREAWLRDARGLFRRDIASGTVIVAYRVVAEAPASVIGGRMPTTAIDLIRARTFGGALPRPHVEALFKPLLIDAG